MKHLFMIQAHAQPNLLKRLVERLVSDNHYILIHIDKKQNLSVFKNVIREDDHVRFTEKRINVKWGGESIWKSTLLLLREGLDSTVHYDYFHLFSGMDYPIVNNEVIDTFFDTCQGKSFMHFDSDEERINWMDSKYKSRLNWNFIEYPILIRKIVHFIRLGKFMDKFYPHPIPENLYAGWAWFSWSRNVALWVLEYVRSHPSEVRKFHNGIATDEMIFHTILHPYLDELKIESNNSLRYIDWHPSRPFSTLPLVLNDEDEVKIRKSGALFCRKVSLPESELLLDKLDGTR